MSGSSNADVYLLIGFLNSKQFEKWLSTAKLKCCGRFPQLFDSNGSPTGEIYGFESARSVFEAEGAVTRRP
jgi:hypothetical protein